MDESTEQTLNDLTRTEYKPTDLGVPVPHIVIAVKDQRQYIVSQLTNYHFYASPCAT